VAEFNLPVHTHIKGFVQHVVGKRIGMLFFADVQHIGRQAKPVEIAACPDTKK